MKFFPMFVKRLEQDWISALIIIIIIIIIIRKRSDLEKHLTLKKLRQNILKYILKLKQNTFQHLLFILEFIYLSFYTFFDLIMTLW